MWKGWPSALRSGGPCAVSRKKRNIMRKKRRSGKRKNPGPAAGLACLAAMAGRNRPCPSRHGRKDALPAGR